MKTIILAAALALTASAEIAIKTAPVTSNNGQVSTVVQMKSSDPDVVAYRVTVGIRGQSQTRLVMREAYDTPASELGTTVLFLAADRLDTLLVEALDMRPRQSRVIAGAID